MIIYKVTNKVNGKIYIGQTVSNLEHRISQHFCAKKSYFHNALHKYGRENFEWKIIEYCESKEEMNEMEFHYIKQYNSVEDGYNLTYGGEGNYGHKFNKAFCKKQSDLKKALYKSGWKHPMLGRNHTKESIKKMSKAVSGKRHNRYGVVGPENPASKEFIITDPLGREFKIKGLKYFCENNNLQFTVMSMCARGLRPQHKGYKCRYLEE
jgi:group I intron endonuclease